MKRRVYFGFLFSFLFILTSEVRAQSTMGQIDLECGHLQTIAKGFLHQHILFDSFTPELEKRTIEQLIKRLDPFKVYLTSKDVEGVKKDLSGLFKQLDEKSCFGLKKAQDLYVKRLEERVKFVKAELGKNFKLDKKATLVIDPKSRKWPNTEKEAQEFHKKYLQFQVANFIATGDKLEEAKAKVSRNYDRLLKKTKEYKETDLYSDYLESFAHALDPHSSYFAKDVLEDFEINMRLQLEGIGATLSSQDGFTVVEQLLPGGAAAKSGLVQPQDKILAVGQVEKGKESDFENVVEMDLRDVVRKIRGKKGTQVRLKILRKSGDKTENLVVTLNRDKISLEDDAASISYLERENNGVKHKLGIINLPSFYSDSRKGGRSAGSDLKRILKEAREKKVDGIVLDLSYNGGGSLEDAVTVSGLFFKTGNVVKQSSRDTGKKGNEASALDDRDSEVDWAGPLVVLTSRISASASEIVAGTLQDYERALIVGGDHTFGKGSIQQVAPLPPGLGAIKVTVGMFFTPGGDSTQHRGVKGDVVLPSIFAADDEEEMGEKSLDYSLPPHKLPPFISKEAFVKSGPGAWKIVTKEYIKNLSDRSKIRISKDPEFDKILKDIKKIESNKKTIAIEDQLKETKEAKTKSVDKKAKSKDQKLADYIKRAEIQEAANVLTDLIDLENKLTLKEPLPILIKTAENKSEQDVKEIKKDGKTPIGLKKTVTGSEHEKANDFDGTDANDGAIKKN